MLNTRFPEFSKEEKDAYLKIAQQGIDMFGGKGNVSVFHRILIDRVADGYLKTQRIDDSTTSKKLENAQKQLQSWLKLVFSEINSVQRVNQDKRDFLQKCIDVIDDNLTDDRLKKSIYKQLKEIIEE